MDVQRADGQGWYGDESYGDPNRYSSLNEERYSQREGFNPYGEEQYHEQPDPQQLTRSERRSGARRGARSGLPMPDAPGQYDGEYGEPQFQEPQYQDAQYGDFPDQAVDDPVRLSARDRQQLRERATQGGGQPLTSALAAGPIETPMVPSSGSPVSGGGGPAALQAPTAAIPAGMRPAAPAATYRSRRPGLAVLLTLAGLITELILLKVLATNVVHTGASAVSGTLGSLFALAGVPMMIVGLYALATGAATAGGPQPGRAWLKTPLAYLPIGLILIVAAGLAA